MIGKSPYNAFGSKVRCVGRSFENITSSTETTEKVKRFICNKSDK